MKGSFETSCYYQKWREKNWGHWKKLCQFMEMKEDTVTYNSKDILGRSVLDDNSARDKNSRRAIQFTNASLSRWKHTVEPRKVVQLNPKKDTFNMNRYDLKLLTERVKWPNTTKLWLWEIRRNLKGDRRKLSENNRGNQNKYEPEDQVRDKPIVKTQGDRNELFKTHKTGLNADWPTSRAAMLWENNEGDRNDRVPRDQRKMGLFKNGAPQITVIATFVQERLNAMIDVWADKFPQVEHEHKMLIDPNTVSEKEHDPGG